MEGKEPNQTPLASKDLSSLNCIVSYVEHKFCIRFVWKKARPLEFGISDVSLYDKFTIAYELVTKRMHRTVPYTATIKRAEIQHTSVSPTTKTQRVIYKLN